MGSMSFFDTWHVINKANAETRLLSSYNPKFDTQKSVTQLKVRTCCYNYEELSTSKQFESLMVHLKDLFKRLFFE